MNRKPIRCFVVDDQSYAVQIIADYVTRVPFLELAGTATNPIDALTRIQQGDIDLVFLDIQMPELTGMQFLKIARDKCRFILTTAYPEYALEGYEHEVIDYLLKPVAFERFVKAAQKAYNQLRPETETIATENDEQDYFFVKGESKNKFIKINYSDVLYIEGLKNYVSVFTNDQRIVTYHTLTELEQQLPRPPFYRVHKSYIISLDKISMVDGNVIYINKQQIPLGETYREQFFRLVRDK